jgi:hypothetical protein
MSQYRTDRYVVGGRRATAGGRAQALNARYGVGHEVHAVYRATRVVELRSLELSFRAIGKRLGISKSQAHRDFWAVMYETRDHWWRQMRNSATP